MYAVRKLSPPQEDLGSVELVGSVGTGETVELQGKQWMVNRIVTMFVLRRGKYQKDRTRLDVVETSRWLLDGYLNQLYKKA